VQKQIFVLLMEEVKGTTMDCRGTLMLDMCGGCECRGGGGVLVALRGPGGERLGNVWGCQITLEKAISS